MNGFKDSLFVGAVPAEPSVADDMVGRYETEMATASLVLSDSTQ